MIPLSRWTLWTKKPIGSGITQQTQPMKMQVSLFHRETITFYVIDSPCHEFILWYPWLSVHDPAISWQRGEIKHWSQFFQVFPSVWITFFLCPSPHHPIIRTFKRYSAKPKPFNGHLIVLGIVPLICYQPPCHPKVKCIHCHVLKVKLWKHTSRKLSALGSSVHPLPQLQ